LGGKHDALGLLARACQSRLLGYFFAVPAPHRPTHEELRALRAPDAIAVVLFGGAPIEQARWQIVATSLAFDPDAWPFPAFAARGAFGDAWTQVRYDPQTLRIVERTPIDAAQASNLPDARFANAHDTEALLRRRIAGEPRVHAYSVCEVRSPVDMGRLQALDTGGRIQFSTPLAVADLERINAFLETHSGVEVRVHGFRHGFDAAQLLHLPAMRDLTLDASAVQHAHALARLANLAHLRIGRARIDLSFLAELESLRTLELRGTRGEIQAVARARGVQHLYLESTPPVWLHALESARAVQTLTLAHGAYTLDGIKSLSVLRRIALRALEVADLSPLCALPHLEALLLEALPHVSDLAPIGSLRMLRELHIARMPHLNVSDFEPLQRCAGLRAFDVEIGSRTKEREINRLMKRGNTSHV
jgi:hypothetical protein